MTDPAEYTQWGFPVRVGNLSGRVVTHQQLTDKAFFDLVKPELLTGQVQVIDQRGDKVLSADGRRLGFDDPDAAVELAKSQMRWVGAKPSAPEEIFVTLGLDWTTIQVRNATQGG